jgi:hypothetical protein
VRWFQWKVEVVTDTGGRYFDTVKARSQREALSRANKNSGNFEGSGWYAVGAVKVA